MIVISFVLYLSLLLQSSFVKAVESKMYRSRVALANTGRRWLPCLQYRYSPAASSVSALFASKHMNSYKSRASDSLSDQINPDPSPDPKKVALLEKLQLDDGVELDLKTGAELRKQRKIELKHKTASSHSKNAKHSVKKTKSTSSFLATQEKAVRFTLGCGADVLTASNLLDLVKSTAPYLFPESGPRIVIEEEDDDDSDAAISPPTTFEESQSYPSPAIGNADPTQLLHSSPSGWLHVLKNSNHIPNTNTPTEKERVDYFALCMAAHFSTVATFVPTDVDSKIRGHCWLDPSPTVIRGQYEVLKGALAWDVDAVSKRTVKVREVDPLVPISGHNGEWLGVMGGAWGAFLRLGDVERAREVEEMMRCELDREARAFRHVRMLKQSTAVDTALLKLAAILTHNVGDVDQGFSYWKEGDFPEKRTLFARLAHERNERFGGEFGRAKLIYKELLSAEGHRNYPLRDPKCLRMTPDLMLPLSPWLEHWGRLVAVHPSLSHDERVQVARQLIRGCDSTSRGWCVPNQVGYYRALQGMVSAMNIERLSKDLDKDCREVLKTHDCRAQLSLSEEAFAARLGARARELLDDYDDAGVAVIASLK